jgi:hypothetical protein
VLTSGDDYVNQYEWLALDRIPASFTVVFENRFPFVGLGHDVMITESEPVLTSTQ